ncbi:hypothetical protein [Actinacidiphila bryophytorum]|uniref:hypothetical protein n=1 Tax=Actinacidiphila bryophytorum TaxID=1436133 RepID=UPI002176D74F|nr:hypothetical protein [Actinacidiphila bryophytorum]UWE13371.1 hypothetical protein NYE86_34985 [Actinacidiphila bryophytorum]
MGTSTRWAGPGGQSGIAAEWSRVSRRLSRWNSSGPQAEQLLDKILDDHLDVLHQTMHEDQSAFGLVDAATKAGYRLADAMVALADEGTGSLQDAGDFLARFTDEVGGHGGTITDAAIRRAAMDTAERLLERQNEETGGMEAGGGGLPGDLLCLLYQWFFADIVTEFLRSVIAEKVKLVAPVLRVLDPGDHIADWAADKVLSLVPSPCEEAAELTEKVKSAESVIEDPVGSLPEIARRLVPGTVGKVLGLGVEGLLERQEGTEGASV